MKLLRMTACFGRLDFDSLELQDGLNLFYLPNEGGKSTWCAFLLTMLYGFHPRARDKKGMPSEKNRYRPWNGKPMEGLLECFHNGSRILLRRHSADGIPMGSFSAIYADSGDPVPGLTSENVGMRLTGVGREIFERSLLIRQTHLAVSQSKELEERISALISSGDEQISWSQVEARLREWQLPRQSRKYSRLSELEAEEQSLTERISQLETLWQDYSLLEEEIAEMEARLKVLSSGDDLSADEQRESLELRWAEAAAQLDAAQLQLQALTNNPASSSSFTAELEADIRSLKKAIRKRGRSILYFSILALLLSASLVFLTFFPSLDSDHFLMERIPILGELLSGLSLPAFAASVAVLGLAIILANALRLRLDRQDLAELDQLQTELDQRNAEDEEREKARSFALSREQSARQRFDLLSQQLRGLSFASSKASSLSRSLAERRETFALLRGRLQELGDPTALYAKLQENRAAQRQLREEYEAISEAISALQQAEQRLRAQFSPKLNDRASEYFSKLTGEVYSNITLDRDFAAQAQEEGSFSPHPSSFLSQGTTDQLYLALRLALCDLILPHGHNAPLVLDDALASFDDKRAALALLLLQDLGKKRQILFFTCHGRDVSFFEKIKAKRPS